MNTLTQSRYWKNDVATRNSFEDGWFLTGDVVSLSTKNDETKNTYKILGRSNIDIIKSGGFKISSLEVEHVLCQLDFVSEAAVFGVPDEVYGEKIVAAVVINKLLSNEEAMSQLAKFARNHLAAYKMPRVFLPVSSLPRNSLGKVSKNECRSSLLPLLVQYKND